MLKWSVLKQMLKGGMLKQTLKGAKLDVKRGELNQILVEDISDVKKGVC